MTWTVLVIDMKPLFLIPVCFYLCCCSNTSGWNECPRKQGDVSALPVNIVIDSVCLDNIHSSLEGFSGTTSNGNIWFFDKNFGYLYHFDLDGHYLRREMGIGNGPTETIIKGASGCCFSTENNFVVIGNNADFQYFSENYKNYVRMEYYDPFSTPGIKPDDFSLYSDAWDNLVHLSMDKKLYMTLNSEFPKFNYFNNTHKYLEKSYRLGVVNIDNGKSNVIIKGFPQIYHDNPYLFSSVPYINIDIYEDGFIVNFEADSTIYLCNRSGFPEFAFGHAGKDMDLNFAPVKSYSSYKEYRKNREEKGRYSSIKYIPETGLIFRSYIKGRSTAHDGLQIYDKEGKLLIDLEVPKNFKITGYIAPFYFSNIFCNDADFSMSLYRMKMN